MLGVTLMDWNSSTLGEAETDHQGLLTCRLATGSVRDLVSVRKAESERAEYPEFSAGIWAHTGARCEAS